MTTTVNLKSAVEYNEKRRAVGKMTGEDDAQLVAFLQEFAPEEIVKRIVPAGKVFLADGKFGDMSSGVLDEVWKNHFLRTEPFTEATTVPDMETKPGTISEAIVRIARAELGNGEELYDNSGPHVVRYRGLPDSYKDDNLGSWHHWCAFFAGYCVQRACDELKRPDDDRFMLFQDSDFGGKLMPIGGARDLVYRAANSKIGKYVARYGKLIEAPQPGDLVAIRYNEDTNERRGPGHVFIIEAVRGGTKVTTIEGNLGKFPSKVKRVERDLMKLGGSAKLLAAARLS